jgi:hypothetical protein
MMATESSPVTTVERNKRAAENLRRKGPCHAVLADGPAPQKNRNRGAAWVNRRKKACKRGRLMSKKKKSNKDAKAVPHGAPINEQDVKRRLGNFSGAGEHPRQGGRTTGIVGQTKQRNKTEKRRRSKVR